MSAKDSEAISRRVIRIREPSHLEHPNFGFASVEPASFWTPNPQMLTAYFDYAHCCLRFKPRWADEYPAFVLLFLFRNPRRSTFSAGFGKAT
jgi:hypothetical protein